MRPAYGEALVALGRRRADVVVVSADVANSDYSVEFQKVFPERFFEVGIAEPSLVDVAVGLSKAGFIPLANSFAFLLSLRALEAISTHLCYGNANVKIMAAYGGLSPSFEGPTHHAIVDLAIMRALPRMTVVVPSDVAALHALLPQVVDHRGPVYFRMNRNEVPRVYAAEPALTLGTASTVRSGGDLAIIATGIMVGRALEAADSLQAEGVEARVVDMHTLKPLDAETIELAARETGAIVAAEEHTIMGGLAAAVAETLAERRPVPMERVGIQDRFADSGPYQDMLDRHGLGVEDVRRACHRVLSRKASARV
jgi:transketolase